MSKPSRSGRVMAWVVLAVLGVISGVFGVFFLTWMFWAGAVVSVRASSWKVGHLAKEFPESLFFALIAVMFVLAAGG